MKREPGARTADWRRTMGRELTWLPGCQIRSARLPVGAVLFAAPLADR